MLGQQRSKVLAGPPSPDQTDRTDRRESNPIHARTVKRIEKGRRVASQDKPVPRLQARAIGQIASEMDVTPDELRTCHHLPGRRVSAEKITQLFPDRHLVIRPIGATLVQDHPDTRVAALQRDPPSPPSVTRDVVCRGAADTDIRILPTLVPAGQLRRIPVPGPAPT